jgi:hypothetical protein
MNQKVLLLENKKSKMPVCMVRNNCSSADVRMDTWKDIKVKAAICSYGEEWQASEPPIKYRHGLANFRERSVQPSSMNNIRTIAVSIFAFVVLTSKSNGQGTVTVQKKVLTSLNATSHTFAIPIRKLKDTLVTFFSTSGQFENRYLKQVFFHYRDNDSLPILFSPILYSDSIHYFSSYKYFQKPNTENDIYLYSSLGPWDSPVYHDHGLPLPFTTPFILKLKSINQQQTMLTIEADKPEVFIGKFFWEQCRSCGVDVMDLRTKKVESSSIEEHCLLQFISSKLGDKKVEPLKVPEFLPL